MRRPAKLERGAAGQPIDPDSDAGRKEARAHERAVATYIAGRDALRLAPDALRVLDAVIVRDQAPAGLAEFTALRNGLSVLSVLWSGRRKSAR
jgi:hypothetical protein